MTLRDKRFLLAFVVIAVVTAFLVAMSGTNKAQATGDDRPVVCVPEDPYTEETDWLLESPGEGWYEIESKEVVDEEAYDEKVVDVEYVAPFWANFQPNDSQAPFVGPPSFPTDPRGSWIIHNNDGGPGQDQSGVYNIGNPHKGGNWFYRQQEVEEVSHIEHHDAVTHMEYRYAFDHPGTQCPPSSPEPPTPTHTDEPEPQPEPDPETPDEPKIGPPAGPVTKSVDNFCVADGLRKFERTIDGELDKAWFKNDASCDKGVPVLKETGM